MGDFGSHGFFTLTELQERLNLEDRKHLTETLREKKIPTTRFGNETFIMADDFAKWLREHQQIGKPPKPSPAAE